MTGRKRNTGKQVTLAEVANRCKLSCSMVSYVLGNPDNCKAKASTKAKIFAMSNKLGYRVNLRARSLRSGRKYTVGILMPNCGGFFYNLMVLLDKELEAKNYYSLFSVWDTWSKDGFFASYERMLQHGVDGIITCHYDPLMEKESVPMVGYGNLRPAMDCVYPDKLSYVKKCIEYLVSKGHSKIGYMGYKEDIRWEAIRRELKHRALKVRNEWFYSGLGTMDAGIMGMSAILKSKEHPSVLITHSDNMALGAIHCADEAGLRIPDDISIISYDNLPESACFSPPLTTFDQRLELAANLLVETVLNRIENPEIPQQKNSFQMQLIERKSVKNLNLTS